MTRPRTPDVFQFPLERLAQPGGIACRSRTAKGPPLPVDSRGTRAAKGPRPRDRKKNYSSNLAMNPEARRRPRAAAEKRHLGPGGHAQPAGDIVPGQSHDENNKRHEVARMSGQDREETVQSSRADEGARLPKPLAEGGTWGQPGRRSSSSIAPWNEPESSPRFHSVRVTENKAGRAALLKTGGGGGGGGAPPPPPYAQQIAQALLGRDSSNYPQGVLKRG